MLDGDSTWLKIFKERKGEFLSWLNTAKGTARTSAENAIIQALTSRFKDYEQARQNALTLERQGRLQEARSELVHASQMFDDMYQQCEAFVAVNENTMYEVLLESPAAEDWSADRIIGNSPAIQEVYKMVGRVAGSEVSVLLIGESGTGKELVARAIYQHSQRDGKPFLAVNCAAIPETLLESELFGYKKGAFTLPQSLSLLREAKKLYPALPIIVITAYSTSFTKAEAMREGADAYFVKPFDLRAFVRKLQAMISGSAVLAASSEFTPGKLKRPYETSPQYKFPPPAGEEGVPEGFEEDLLEAVGAFEETRKPGK
jgi:hypothetical protein